MIVFYLHNNLEISAAEYNLIFIIDLDLCEINVQMIKRTTANAVYMFWTGLSIYFIGSTRWDNHRWYQLNIIAKISLFGDPL